LELWENTATALIEGRLPVFNRLDRLNPRTTPKMSLGRGWLRHFRLAVQRGSDPSSFKQILKHIIVRTADFEKWQRKARDGRRGPQPATTGYQAADRKVFPLISKLIASGQAQSPYGAALLLTGTIAGKATPENKARRISALYRKERTR
jgi:hypothetical protein